MNEYNKTETYLQIQWLLYLPTDTVGKEKGKRKKCVRVKSLQLCPTLCDPMDCRLPGSSIHGILQARILKWVAMPFSGGWGCDSYAAVWFASSSVLTPLLFFLFLICVCTHFLVFLLFHLFTFILFLAMPQGMQDQTCGPCIGSTES